MLSCRATGPDRRTARHLHKPHATRCLVSQFYKHTHAMKDETVPCGIRISGHASQITAALTALLQRHRLLDQVDLGQASHEGAPEVSCALRPDIAARWLPGFDSTGLAALLGLDGAQRSDDLEQEILITLLASPVRMAFPSVDELLANIHMRRNISTAGRRTELDFHTTAAERPEDCWREDPDNGFVVRPGCALVDALIKATQPEQSGHLYTFSCYRATEYVILLGIAQELAVRNPALLQQLQARCERHVIRSGQFHDVFLHEYGTQDAPIPTHYYIPGDRVWFRNPDEQSSDAIGFEGSWVLYLGGGLFSNLWARDKPYTLADKCLEIYHWRDGAYQDAAGEWQMDESIVRQRMAQTRQQPDALRQILARMMLWRAPKGVYNQGGCIDTTREGPRWICPGTADLVLPA